jgi:hypothetical protein
MRDLGQFDCQNGNRITFLVTFFTIAMKNLYYLGGFWARGSFFCGFLEVLEGFETFLGFPYKVLFTISKFKERFLNLWYVFF